VFVVNLLAWGERNICVPEFGMQMNWNFALEACDSCVFWISTVLDLTDHCWTKNINKNNNSKKRRGPESEQKMR